METNTIIASYVRDPVGFVPMDNPTCFWKQENALCGDFVEVYLKISPQGTIEAFSYQGDLAMHTLAASSLLAEYICGNTIDTVLSRNYETMKNWGFVVSARRQRSAVTSLVAVHNAIHQWRTDGKTTTYDDLLL